MAPSSKKLLIVNVLYWVVGAMLHPLANLITAGTGETPKFFSFLIPLVFVGLAFGSTWMMARAANQATR